MRGILLMVALVSVLAWALFGAVRATNSQRFCTSCHAMDGVTAEWRESPHFANAGGIAVTCADCHVAPGVLPTLGSKIHSLHAELLPWLMGVDTSEEVEAERERLAHSVWDAMRANDSANCRACHQMGPEALALQDTRARSEHEEGERDGETCIDCHDDGVAHRAIEKEEESEAWDGDDDFTL